MGVDLPVLPHTDGMKSVYEGRVSAASIRSCRPSISRSCSAVGASASEDVRSRRERDTKVLVIAAVMTVRTLMPNKHHEHGDEPTGDGHGNVVAVADRRDGVDGPPEP